MDLELNGKAALVTGANRGIGKEIALAFAREGVDVGICARDSGKLDEVRQAIEAFGVRCAAVTSDLDEDGACEHVVDAVSRQLGRLDILVNNASTNVDGMGVIKANSVDELMRRVTGKATWAIKCTQAALPHLIASGAGRIIFIGGTALRSSYVAGASNPRSGVASAMGSALIAVFAKYLQEEVIGDNITVNVIHPGGTRTDRFPGRVRQLAEADRITYAEAEARIVSSIPLKRIVETTDVAPMVLFLASPLAAAVAAQALAIDGGTVPAVVY